MCFLCRAQQSGALRHIVPVYCPMLLDSMGNLTLFLHNARSTTRALELLIWRCRYTEFAALSEHSNDPTLASPAVRGLADCNDRLRLGQWTRRTRPRSTSALQLPRC